MEKMETNYYNKIPSKILDNLLEERKINLPPNSTVEDKKKALLEYDSKHPEIIQSFRSSVKPREDILAMDVGTLFLYAVLSNVPLHFVDLDKDLTENLNDLKEYIAYYEFLFTRFSKSSANNLEASYYNRDAFYNFLSKKLGVDEILLKLTRPEKLQKAIKEWNPEIITKSKGNLERYKTFQRVKKLKHPELFAKLYIGYEADDYGIINNILFKGRDYELEEEIMKYDDKDYNEIWNEFGMIIPHFVNAERYVFTNLPVYVKGSFRKKKIDLKDTDVLKGTNFFAIRETLSKYTDVEIMSFLKVFLPFNSRRDLINNYSIWLSGVGIFFGVPLDRDFLVKNSKNKVTFTGIDLATDDDFFICYGNYRNFRTYTLEEFLSVFSSKKDTINPFPVPEHFNNREVMFDINTLIFLTDLMRFFPQYKPARDLIYIINAGEDYLESLKDFQDNFQKYFKEIKEEQRSLIKEYLYGVFYTGMYMRQWDGNLGVYPLLAKDTRKKQNLQAIEENVRKQAEKTMQILEKMDETAKAFVKGLFTVNYLDGKYIVEGERLYSVLSRAILGQFCIRMSSKIIIISAYYFIQILFNEEILGMDVSKLEEIS